MLRIAVIAPTAILEAVVGVGVTRIAAKAARCASSVLGIRVVFPAAVLQRMVLLRGRSNVGIADAAIFFDCMLRFIILIVFRACAVATVLIFSTTAAIVASAIASMLRRRIILPITIGIRAVGRAPINDFAAVLADFFPITSIPRCIGIVVLTGRIFFVAALCADTSGIETMGFTRGNLCLVADGKIFLGGNRRERTIYEGQSASAFGRTTSDAECNAVFP